jgi:hypothetical protein
VPFRPYTPPQPPDYRADEYACPACKRVLSPATFPFRVVAGMEGGNETAVNPQPCPHCGHPLYELEKCDYCKKAVFRPTRKSAPGSTYPYYHTSCLPLSLAGRGGAPAAAGGPQGSGCALVALAMVALAAVAFAVALPGLTAEDPPAKTSAAGAVMWRFDGAGRFPTIRPPSEWGPDSNILWKAHVEVGGYSSPIVVKDRVFLTAEMGSLICLDLADGKCLWKKNLFSKDSPDLPAALSGKLMRGIGGESKQSTPTPASNGEFVFCINATGLCVCYDLQGNRKWIRIVETAEDEEHFSSSPIFLGDRIVLSWGCLLALDAKDGTTLWKAAKARPTHGTPAVATVGGVAVVVTPAGDIVRLTDGEILCSGLFESTYTTPLVEGNVLYLVDREARALRLPDRAKKGMKPVELWKTKLDGDFMASPVYKDGLLYTIENKECRLHVIDAITGRALTATKAVGGAGEDEKGGTGVRVRGLRPANYAYASPAASEKHVYFFDDAGNTAVLETGRQHKPVRVNKLDDAIIGTPFFVRDRIIIRGSKTVYCIAEKR